MNSLFKKFFLALLIFIKSCNTPNTIKNIKKNYVIETKSIYHEPTDYIFTNIKKNLKKNKNYDLCIKLSEKFKKQLDTFIKVNNISKIPSKTIREIISMDLETCSLKNYKILKKIYDSYISIGHKKNIIILPLSGKHKALGISTLEGIRSYVKKYKIPFKDHYKIYDNKSNINLAKKIIALSLLQNGSKSIIGGIIPEVSSFIHSISKELDHPSFVFYENPYFYNENDFLFQISPSNYLFLNKLIKECKEKSYKKIDILTPQSKEGEILSTFFEKQAKANNLIINNKKNYISGDFYSMNESIKEIANLNSDHRKKKHIQMLLENEEKNQEGIELINYENIILKPKIESQALLILDNFRIVKHFSKLMKFHNIKNLPLIGGNEWRDLSLIYPKNFLSESSFFVDFLPSYDSLPINTGKYNHKGLFLSEQNPMHIDYKVFGYYLLKILSYTHDQKSIKTKVDFKKFLKDLKSKKIFKTSETEGKIFDNMNQLQWPIYVFKIKDNTLNLVKKNK